MPKIDFNRIKCRKARLADAKGMSKVSGSSYQTAEVFRGLINQAQGRPDLELYVATLRGEVVGFCEMHFPVTGGVTRAKLEQLYVLQEHSYENPLRGNRKVKGVGRKLFSIATRRARKSGANHMTWTTTLGAMNFYKRVAPPGSLETNGTQMTLDLKLKRPGILDRLCRRARPNQPRA